MMNRFRLGLLASSAITSILQGLTPEPSAGVPIGMNLALGGNSYYGYQYPFLDRFKTAGVNGSNTIWQARAADYTQFNSPATPIDAKGWPTALPAGAANISAIIGVDRSVEGQINTYRLRYTGTKPFSFSNATVLNDTIPGEIILSFTGSGEGDSSITIYLEAPILANTTIEVVRTDQTVLFDSGKIFNPAFLAISEPWKILRFMDWLETNTTPVTTWASRKKIDSASWFGHGGVPYEVCIALANELDAPAWINIPHAADINHMQQAAALIHSSMKPGSRVFIEYGNEIGWNFANPFYIASNWVGDGWVAMYGADGAAPFKGAGYFAARCAEIFATEFAGERHRLTNVLGTQTVSLSVSDAKEIGIQTYGYEVNELFDMLALTSYYGGDMSGYNPSDRATILGWKAMGAAGLDLAFEQMEHGGLLTASPDSLDNVIDNQIPPQKAWALARGIDWGIYEAGYHITAFLFGDDTEEALEFHVALANDPRSGALYARAVVDCIALGGQTYPVFYDMDAPSFFGIWGSQSSPYRAETPRYSAIKALALSPPPNPPLTISGTPIAPKVATSLPFVPSVVGGVMPRIITLVGSLPPGRTFNGKTESGEYTTQGTYNYSYHVVDAQGGVDDLPVSVTVGPQAVGYRAFWIIGTHNANGSFASNSEYGSFAEIIAYEADNDVIPYTGATFSGSTEYFGEQAFKAFDGNTGTFWTSQNTGPTQSIGWTLSNGNQMMPAKIGLVARMGLEDRSFKTFQIRCGNVGDIHTTGGILLATVSSAGAYPTNGTPLVFTLTYP